MAEARSSTRAADCVSGGGPAALTKGGNAPLDAGLSAVLLSAHCDSGHVLDVSGLLLGAGGKVRSDDGLHLLQRAELGRRHADLERRGHHRPARRDPAEIDRIAITVSADEAPFREVSGLRIVVSSAGDDLLRFDVPASADETAVLLGELYRRAGGWKFRAVGQGWASGLAGLATDFGITVDDDRAGGGAACRRGGTRAARRAGSGEEGCRAGPAAAEPGEGGAHQPGEALTRGRDRAGRAGARRLGVDGRAVLDRGGAGVRRAGACARAAMGRRRRGRRLHGGRPQPAVSGRWDWPTRGTFSASPG